MSLRDPLFAPVTLLADASDADASSSEEKEALQVYRSLADQLDSENKKLVHLREFIESQSSAFTLLSPDIQNSIQRQLVTQEKNVSQLMQEINEMAFGELLRPVVDKVYIRAREEDLKKFQEEQIAEAYRREEEIRKQWRLQRRKLTEKTFDERYKAFLSVHKNSITSELRSAYEKNRSCHVSEIDFGGHVCIPLFAIWALSLFLLPKPVKTIMIVFISVIYIGLAFWLHHYIDSTIDNICRRYFEETNYKSIVLDYVRRCKNNSLCAADSQTAKDDITTFFESCEKRIVDEYFSYKKS